MCGINGIFGLDGSRRPEKIIRTMNRILSHRGPDDEGIYTDNKLALGHRRLSILDLSEAGHQPMSSFDGRYTITFNGEIYNYEEVKKELPDYPYRSDTDTEVLLAAYMKWGKKCLDKLNGMFAFAVWDSEKQQLFIARDRLGIKPLYYYQQEQQLVFSSELRALLSSGLVPRKVNQPELVDYLKYQTVHAPKTIIQDVKMLMPGHCMTVRRDGMAVEQYWCLPDYAQSVSGAESYSTVKKNVRRLLKASVNRRLMADVPVGAFLSGGIDSSAVVALMSELSPGNVKTFSVTFDETEYSEAPYSQLVADKFDTDHTEIRLRPDDFLQLLPEALNAMDYPSGDGPNTYLVSKKTREAGVTVALSGLGGDELFAGYRMFARSLKLRKYSWIAQLPLGLRRVIGDIIKETGRKTATDKISDLIQRPTWELKHTYPLARQVYREEDVRQLLQVNGEANSNAVEDIVQAMDISDIRQNILSKVSCSEIQTYMQNVLLRDTDQMSMASALEVRVPFLDHALAEYVLSLPDNVKYPHSPKKLLVDSLHPLLPDEIVHRKKMGFTFPWSIWMKNELRGMVIKNIEALAERPHFNADQLMNVWQRFLNNDGRINWARIWILVVLERWLQNNEVT